jgi:hypothetical protein
MQLTNLNNEFGLTKVRKLYRFPIKNKALDEKYGLSRTYVLEFADAINISAAVQSYENLSAMKLRKVMEFTMLFLID